MPTTPSNDIRDKKGLPILEGGLYVHEGQTLPGMAGRGVRQYDGAVYRIDTLTNNAFKVSEELGIDGGTYTGDRAIKFASRLIPLNEEQVSQLKTDRKDRLSWLESGKITWS